MLSFDIRSLESHAVVVDEELSANDPVWASGPGRFYWHGRIEGDVALECSRCLTETQRHVSDEAHLIFADSEENEEIDDDPDVYLIDSAAIELDLRPALREQWILAAPTFALCREDCMGFCPRCGADLNAGPHDCSHEESDPRWEALRKLKESPK